MQPLNHSFLAEIELWHHEGRGNATCGSRSWGYLSSKRRYFYGLDIHLLVKRERLSVEVFLAPDANNDTAELKDFSLDLREGATMPMVTSLLPC